MKTQVQPTVDESTLVEARAITETAAAGRGSLVSRFLALADVTGLGLAFFIAHALGGGVARVDVAVFIAFVPAWLLIARLYGLYANDNARTDHSTADEFIGVFNFVTLSAWLLFGFIWFSGAGEADFGETAGFWAAAVGLVAIARVGARAFTRRRGAHLQRAVIVGAGDVGQLLARKILQHPEYGIQLVGFVDSEPRELRQNLSHLPLLGTPDALHEIVPALGIERVVVAFSNDGHQDTLDFIRALKDLDVRIDIVPRLFEALGTNLVFDGVEGLPLVGIPRTVDTRSSRVLKRVLDIVGASLALIAAAPLIALIAIRIKRDSPGPVFFKQTRLGMGMREFTSLKFRTMKVDTSDEKHREYIKAIMDTGAVPQANGLFKLNRDDAITKIGRWLRKTSLDELPQLINVVRGDMSLVGPRPCIPYEVEHFAPHHFERFQVPAGLTGLWQVTARANSTFGEALDMDVRYARSSSVGLDLRLLFKTPLQMVRQKQTT